MVSTRFVLVITFWSYQCLPDFLMAYLSLSCPPVVTFPAPCWCCWPLFISAYPCLPSLPSFISTIFCACPPLFAFILPMFVLAALVHAAPAFVCALLPMPPVQSLFAISYIFCAYLSCFPLVWWFNNT